VCPETADGLLIDTGSLQYLSTQIVLTKIKLAYSQSNHPSQARRMYLCKIPQKNACASNEIRPGSLSRQMAQYPHARLWLAAWIGGNKHISRLDLVSNHMIAVWQRDCKPPTPSVFLSSAPGILEYRISTRALYSKPVVMSSVLLTHELSATLGSQYLSAIR
jgi:hypothetical protein